jgi:hypothetical protein
MDYALANPEGDVSIRHRKGQESMLDKLIGVSWLVK